MSAARTVTVAATRLARWVDGFGVRHRGFEVTGTADGLELVGGDGERAELTLPFLPWDGASVEDAEAHLARPRRTLVLIIRRGGFACAVVDSRSGHGSPGAAVTSSKVGSRYVQGRTAAGGWSQQRYARRRQAQADRLVEAAVAVAVDRLPRAVAERAGDGRTEIWLATGGDRALTTRALQDRRLARLHTLPHLPHLAVGDPGRETIAALPDLLSRLTITLHPPASRGES